MFRDADDDRSEYEPSDEEVEDRARELKEGVEEAVNGASETVVNGAQKVLGDAPSTPDRSTTATEQGTIGSRVKQRKGAGKS